MFGFEGLFFVVVRKSTTVSKYPAELAWHIQSANAQSRHGWFVAKAACQHVKAHEASMGCSLGGRVLCKYLSS